MRTFKSQLKYSRVIKENLDRKDRKVSLALKAKLVLPVRKGRPGRKVRKENQAYLGKTDNRPTRSLLPLGT